MTATEGEDLLAFQIFVEDENGDLVTIATQEEEGTQSTFVTDSPGEFSLNINGANATYTVTVEDCTGAGNGGNGNGNNNGGSATDQYTDQYADEDQQQQQQQQVINIPNKPLPNTGGFPPLLAGGFFLVAGAGLAVSIVRRRY